MVDTILYKLKLLKELILDYAADRYDIEQWPIGLQYDLDDIETIETCITEYNHPITKSEMIRCNKLYKRYYNV